MERLLVFDRKVWAFWMRRKRLKGTKWRIIDKPVSSHTFRHSFSTHLLQNGCDIRTAQELLVHKDLKTTIIYTYVLQRGGLVVRSPLDG
jgi:site-specific recombinase XerD